MDDPTAKICANVLVTVPALLVAVKRMLEMTSIEEAGEVVKSEAKRQRVDVLEWKWMKNSRTVFLDHYHMFCDRATEQLLAIHKSKYYHALKGYGMELEIPIVDNVFGLGKSTFGQNYIRICREKWPGPAAADAVEFLPVLRACHTMHIILPTGFLLTEKHHENIKK